mmetsp:Transcript_93923/g.172220  ORF Transcript_93923/g.172220 Transcript_93923/m.172220 type:complete len:272 (-) Transcript_93923:42-857(-)
MPRASLPAVGHQASRCPRSHIPRTTRKILIKRGNTRWRTRWLPPRLGAPPHHSPSKAKRPEYSGRCSAAEPAVQRCACPARDCARHQAGQDQSHPRVRLPRAMPAPAPRPLRSLPRWPVRHRDGTPNRSRHPPVACERTECLAARPRRLHSHCSPRHRTSTRHGQQAADVSVQVTAPALKPGDLRPERQPRTKHWPCWPKHHLPQHLQGDPRLQVHSNGYVLKPTRVLPGRSMKTMSRGRQAEPWVTFPAARCLPAMLPGKPRLELCRKAQ